MFQLEKICSFWASVHRSTNQPIKVIPAINAQRICFSETPRAEGIPCAGSCCSLRYSRNRSIQNVKNVSGKAKTSSPMPTPRASSSGQNKRRARPDEPLQVLPGLLKQSSMPAVPPMIAVTIAVTLIDRQKGRTTGVFTVGFSEGGILASVTWAKAFAVMVVRC